ncbi:hypothetical protein [Methanimicrococcus blatticola]|uniref:hypothetical protein n=1 Tax=Methanimicrococcus blatticola TaxID=91560 RepID=UPI00105B32B8|nr:hypothetical protein [Methanimicrococcus blatticola]MBZ3935377.1 hypothetical protein [Methanimicrococcus blatticola]MCC2508525.1 hypothetical protein [Methanimicrococcus blatticola]
MRSCVAVCMVCVAVFICVCVAVCICFFYHIRSLTRTCHCYLTVCVTAVTLLFALLSPSCCVAPLCYCAVATPSHYATVDITRIFFKI